MDTKNFQMDTSSCNFPDSPRTSVSLTNSKEKEEKKRSLKQFIISLPRTLSPSVFQSSKNQRSNNGDSMDTMDTADQFNWSIDQIARLNPMEFSMAGHVTSFDQSTEMYLKKESEEFFKASLIVPSPPGPVANEVFVDENNSNYSNMSHTSGTTPVRSLSASETKVPTPVNVTRGKQKKKLFAEDRSHFSFDTLEEESSQEANVLHSSNLLGHTSVDAYMHASITCSPIIGNTSVIMEEETIEQETVALTSAAMASLDSGCVTAKSMFFKTSTPSRLLDM